MKTATLSVLAVLSLVSPSLGDFDCKQKISDGLDSLRDSVSRGVDFVQEAAQGSKDMWDAYSDMREANWIGADKYFHSRGNHDAAERGPGGKWAAEVISDTREFFQGSHSPDSIADQEANRWGREGGDPNKYRPEGLPDKY